MFRWRTTMAPEAYADLVSCPLLYLDATNDQHGKMDWVLRSLAEVSAPVRHAFSPRYRHHILPDQAPNLPLWMNTWVKHNADAADSWLKSPDVKLSLDENHVPRLNLTAFELTNRNGFNLVNGLIQVSLSILHRDHRLYAFANVHYMSSACLSSDLAAAIPAQLDHPLSSGLDVLRFHARPTI